MLRFVFVESRPPQAMALSFQGGSPGMMGALRLWALLCHLTAAVEGVVPCLLKDTAKCDGQIYAK